MWRKFFSFIKYFKGEKKVGFSSEGLLTSLEYKDGDYFIAHCLEFDIVAQGKTREEARHNLAELIKEQFAFAIEKDIEEKVLFKPAPAKYWELVRHLKNRETRKILLKTPHLTTKDILKNLESIYAHV